MALEIWKILDKHDIICQAIHVPGENNSIADFQSRNFSDSNDYYLYQSSFSHLISLLPFRPTIDLFATRVSTKLNKYVSWKYDPYAVKINAFSFTWTENSYLFPPIYLIDKCISKLISDNVDKALIITPAWQGLNSMPLIIQHLFHHPIFIPFEHIGGYQPTRYRFHLMAFPFSANPARRETYHQTLSRPCSRVFHKKHLLPTLGYGNALVSMLEKQGHKISFLLN